jgi:hypothetical protein
MRDHESVRQEANTHETPTRWNCKPDEQEALVRTTTLLRRLIGVT